PPPRLFSVSDICSTWPRTETVVPAGGAGNEASARDTARPAPPRSLPARFAVTVTARWLLMRSIAPGADVAYTDATSLSRVGSPPRPTGRFSSSAFERRLFSGTRSATRYGVPLLGSIQKSGVVSTVDAVAA